MELTPTALNKDTQTASYVTTPQYNQLVSLESTIQSELKISVLRRKAWFYVSYHLATKSDMTLWRYASYEIRISTTITYLVFVMCQTCQTSIHFKALYMVIPLMWEVAITIFYKAISTYPTLTRNTSRCATKPIWPINTLLPFLII